MELLLHKTNLQLHFIFSIILLLQFFSSVLLIPSITRLYPEFGPTTGYTIISVWGSDFVINGSQRSDCQFESDQFGEASLSTSIFNSSYLECSLPSLDSEIANYINLGFANNTYVVNLRVTGLDGTSSNLLNFTYFNLSLMYVLGMSPKEGFYFSPYTVTFSASFIPDTRNFACILLDTIYPILQYDLELQTFTCNIPGVDWPSLQTIHLSIIYDVTGIVSPLSPALTQFTFYSDKPQVVVAYNPSLVYLFLDFDRQVEFGTRDAADINQIPECSRIFSISTQELIGPNCRCSWFTYQQRRLVIELTDQSTLTRASQMLIFANNYQIRTRHVQYSYLISRVTIAPDSKTILPRPFIVASYIPSCGVVSIDVGQSQLSGSQNFTIIWSILSGTPQNLTALVNIFSSLSNALYFSINTDEFVSDVTYTMTANFTNFLSNNNTYAIELTKVMYPFPTVTVRPPHLSLIYTDRQHTIYSSITRQSCATLDMLALKFTWRISTDNGELAYNVNNTFQSSLFLPSLSLVANNNYIITYSVEYNQLTQIQMVQISPIKGRPVALVLGGALVSVSYNDDVIIDATGSYDPYDSGSNLIFRWMCLNSQSPCINVDGNELLAVLNIVTSSQTFIIPAKFITQMFIFDLTLTVETTDGRYSLPFNQKINFYQRTEVDFPTLAIIPTSLLYIPANRELILFIEGRINTSLIDATVTINGDEVVKYDSLDLDSDNLVYHVALADLYIQPAEIQLLPSARSAYFLFEISSTLFRTWQKYRFTVSHSTYNHSYDVTIASAPHSGVLTVSANANGTYTLRADSWSDEPDSLPLTYRFGIISSVDRIHWLTPSTHLLYLDTIIFSEMDKNLEFIVRIENYLGSITDFSINSSIIKFTDEISALNAVNSTLINSYDVIQGTSILSSILYYRSDTKNSIPLVISTLLWNYFSVSYLTLAPTSRDFSEHGLYLLNQFILNVDTPIFSSIFEEILNLYIHFFENINNCPPSGQFFNRGISQQLLNLTVEALDRMIEDNITSIANFHKIYLALLQVGAATRNHFHTSTLILAGSYFKVKVSNTHLTSQYYTTCNYYLTDCSLTQSLPYMAFSRNTFDLFYEWDCRSMLCPGYKMFESLPCSGVTLITSQIPSSIYKSKSIYSHQLLSDLHSVNLVTPSLLDMQLPDPYHITFPSAMQFDASNSNPMCAIWDAATLEWNSKNCTLVSISANLFTCRCQSSGIIGVINNCSSGQYGVNCSVTCPPNLWGVFCEEACQCTLNGVCRPSDGFCDCDPGYTGDMCEQACTPNFYGKFCSHSCQCSDSNTINCSSIDGTCTCKPGWRGELCNETCHQGNWGLACAETCICENLAVCNPVDGTCTCQVGYFGDTCSQTCPAWFFGDNCTSQCDCVIDYSFSCNRITGECDCNPGHTGANCSIVPTIAPTSIIIPDDMPSSSSTVLIVIILVVILLLIAVLFVVLIVGCCLWKKINSRHVTIRPEEQFLVVKEPSFTDNFTTAKSLVIVAQPDLSTSSEAHSGSAYIEEEIEWNIVELVVPVGSDQWRPSSEVEENPFQVPQKPIIQEFSLSGHYSHENPSVQHSMFPMPILLPRNEYTLVDLRNAFIDSGQWSGGPFQFLRKDVPFTFIHLLDEDDFLLTGFKLHTIYIQRVKDTTLHAIELCVCGRVAESECSHCNERGYCGIECQTSDWERHSADCLSAQNREAAQLNVTLDTLASLEFEDEQTKKDSVVTILPKITEVMTVHTSQREERIIFTPDEMLTVEEKEQLENIAETDEVMVIDIFK